MRKGKRFFKAFVLAAAFCAMSTVPYTSHASALDVPRAASDNTFVTASRINMGDTLNGSITETKDYNNYQFQLDSAGCITLNMTAYMRYYCIRIYETDGIQILMNGMKQLVTAVMSIIFILKKERIIYRSMGTEERIMIKLPESILVVHPLPHLE